MLAIIAAIIGLLVWVVIEDGRQMEREKSAFYEQCLPKRERYDCEMQWKTYETAHSAEMSASMAVGIAAGSAAGGKK
jgi:hypothetical protein